MLSVDRYDLDTDSIDAPASAFLDDGLDLAFVARYEETLRRYLEHAGSRVRRMQVEMSRAVTLPVRLERVRDDAHQLAGSGRSFGCPSISVAARALHDFVGQIGVLRGESEDDVQWGDGVEAQARACTEALAAAVNHIDVHRAARRVARVLDRPTHEVKPAPIVWLWTDDRDEQARIESELPQFGYRTVPFDATLIEPVGAGLASRPCAIVIAARAYCESDSVADVARLVERLTSIRQRYPEVPQVLVARPEDICLRIAAIRAGVEGHVVEPASVTGIAERLDELTDAPVDEPYRVLIVDDDPVLADFYSAILNRANIETCVVNDPLAVVEPLTRFRPELIVLDVQMHGCNGFELATAVRHEPRFVGVPIIFLTIEGGARNYRRALASGGDDLLAKPIVPSLLVSTLKSRLRRARAVAAHLDRDPLTGLLNHRRLDEQLGTEAAAADRRGDAVAFAMLDLDHFKRINDTYGHAAGDRALQSVAHVLRLRLRRTDFIGRCGGEEFGIVLPGTERDVARALIDELRVRISEIALRVDGQRIDITTSAGVATSRDFPSAEALRRAADAALYDAKRRGRDRVCVAPELE